MIYFGLNVYLSTNENVLKCLNFSARNNFSIWKTCRQNDLLSISQNEGYHKKASKRQSIKLYSIHSAETFKGYGNDKSISPGDGVGVCGLTSFDSVNQTAEFSCLIFPEYQGHKFSVSALMTLLNHSFLNLNLNCVWGEVFMSNKKALKLFKKVGFVEEGILRKRYYRGGKFRDVKAISILKEEWRDLKYSRYKQLSQVTDV